MSRRSSPLVICLALAACGPSAAEREAAAEAARLEAATDTVEMAATAFDAAAFDTVSWVSPDSAAARGQTVFTYSCQKCHGSRGDGTGGFVTQGDTLRPPTFLGADWQFAEDHDALRRHIFVGTTGGMPHWGIEGLKPRDIDAVATYIQTRLRS